MNTSYHGIKTPDGLDLYRVLPGPIPDGLPADQFWPVNSNIPDGFIRVGWQLINSSVEPILQKIIEPQDNTIPLEIPLWAFRAILTTQQLSNSVENLINSLPEPQKTVANIQWNYGNFIDRNHPLIDSLGTQLGLTKEQIDGIFIEAAKLK